jgi:hypothetical protein
MVTPKPYNTTHARTRESDNQWCRHDASPVCAIVLVDFFSGRYRDIRLGRHQPQSTVTPHDACRGAFVKSASLSVVYLAIITFVSDLGKHVGSSGAVCTLGPLAKPRPRAKLFRGSAPGFSNRGGVGKFGAGRIHRPAQSLADAELKNLLVARRLRWVGTGTMRQDSAVAQPSRRASCPLCVWPPCGRTHQRPSGGRHDRAPDPDVGGHGGAVCGARERARPFTPRGR